jgi:DNA mismatch repair ATPase MutL
VKCDPSVAASDFRKVISDEVAPALAASSDISKVRIRLLEFYDNDAVTLLAPNVSNHEDAKDQYQGCIEIMFTNAFARRRFGESETSSATADSLLAVCSEISIMRALKTFTVYNHGSITTAGLRTPQMADQIKAIGAINQIDDSVRDLILKEHTHFKVK